MDNNLELVRWISAIEGEVKHQAGEMVVVARLDEKIDVLLDRTARMESELAHVVKQNDEKSLKERATMTSIAAVLAAAFGFVKDLLA